MRIESLRSRSHAIAALAASLFASAQCGDVNASDLQPLGGPGGSPFNERCSDGELLAGFELRAGDDVDAIRPLCVTAFGPNQTGPVSQSRWHGGSGGSVTSVICPHSEPIVTGFMIGAEGPETRVVNNILLYCGRAAPNQVPAAQPSTSAAAYFNGPDFGGGSHGFFSRDYDGIVQQCPAGQFAVGVLGRSGNLLDAVGLICGNLPAALNVAGKSIGRVNSGTTTPAPKRTLCEAARDARARNSPAAPNLEAQCRAANLAAATTGRESLPAIQAAEPAASRPADEPAQSAPSSSKQATRDAAILALVQTIAAAGQARSSADNAYRSDAVPRRHARDPRQERQDAAYRPVEAAMTQIDGGISQQDLSQPEHSIRVEVRYPVAYGYKDDAGLFDPAPNSCSAFYVSVVQATTTRMRELTRIDTEPHMRSVDGMYACDYLITDQPLDAPITVRVAMSDQRAAGSAIWLGGTEPQPPQGQRRTIANGDRQILLTASRPRESLSFEMRYIGGIANEPQ